MTSSATSRPASPEPAAPRVDAGTAGRASARVVVLADDLIWSTRLSDILAALGATPVRLRSLDGLEGVAASHVVIDLTARAYDGVAAVRAASGLGLSVLAIGQHDDVAIRRAALAAGASRVLAYRKLFEDGPATLGRWLAETSAS